VIDEVEEPVVRPMQVLEHEDERALLRQSLQEPTPRRERFGLVLTLALVGASQSDERPEVTLDPRRIVGIWERRRDGLMELVRGHILVVVVDDPGLRFHDLPESPIGERLPVRKRSPLPPRDQLLFSLDDLEELRDQPALADAGDAHQRDELRRSLAPRSVERVRQEAELSRPADQRRARALFHVEPEP
jgi:hypothetical protein